MFARSGFVTTVALAFAAIATSALVACSGATNPTSSSEQDLVQRGGKGDDGNKDTNANAGDGGKSAANTNGTGGDTGKGSGKPTEPEPPADPTCVANCNANLKAKCDGDDEFCADMCRYMEPAQLACVIAAPSCEKTEWVRCAEENPGDAGAGTKGQPGEGK